MRRLTSLCARKRTNKINPNKMLCQEVKLGINCGKIRIPLTAPRLLPKRITYHRVDCMVAKDLLCSDKKNIKWIWNGKVVHKLRASEHVVHFIVLCLCLGPILRSVSVGVSIVVFNDVIVLALLVCCLL